MEQLDYLRIYNELDKIADKTFILIIVQNRFLKLLLEIRELSVSMSSPYFVFYAFVVWRAMKYLAA